MRCNSISDEFKVKAEARIFLLSFCKRSYCTESALCRIQYAISILRNKRRKLNSPLLLDEYIYLAKEKKSIDQAEAIERWGNMSLAKRQEVTRLAKEIYGNLNKIGQLMELDKSREFYVELESIEHGIGFSFSNKETLSFELSELHESWGKYFIDSWNKKNEKRVEEHEFHQTKEGIISSISDSLKIPKTYVVDALSHFSASEVSVLELILSSQLNILKLHELIYVKGMPKVGIRELVTGISDLIDECENSACTKGEGK